MVLSFIDSGILIAAARGNSPRAQLASDLETLTQSAYQLACTYGLSGLDALNVAAAILLEADEFITTEKSTKPMYRVPDIQFVTV